MINLSSSWIISLWLLLVIEYSLLAGQEQPVRTVPFGSISLLIWLILITWPCWLYLSLCCSCCCWEKSLWKCSLHGAIRRLDQIRRRNRRYKSEGVVTLSTKCVLIFFFYQLYQMLQFVLMCKRWELGDLTVKQETADLVVVCFCLFALLSLFACFFFRRKVESSATITGTIEWGMVKWSIS